MMTKGRIFLSYPYTNNGFHFLLTTVFIYLFSNNLPEVPDYAKMQFHMVRLLDVLGNISFSIPGAGKDFLSQGKISDILIRCARKQCMCAVAQW